MENNDAREMQTIPQHGFWKKKNQLTLMNLNLFTTSHLKLAI